MKIKYGAQGQLVFSKSDGGEIEITKFDPIPNKESRTARAKEILHLYGGYDKYSHIYPDTRFYSADPTSYHSSDKNRTYCLDRDEKGISLPSPPLQTFPNGSPLDLVKQELAKDDKIIQPVTFFSNGSSLTAEQIKQIKEDQNNVVRLAVKSRLVGTDIKTKCFADKEVKDGRLSKENYGLMSSYIAPTTFYLNQSGDRAAQKANKETRAYITGFGYPVFDENYIGAIHADNKQKKDELKAIFKQQIYAVLLSRQQQVES